MNVCGWDFFFLLFYFVHSHKGQQYSMSVLCINTIYIFLPSDFFGSEKSMLHNASLFLSLSYLTRLLLCNIKLIFIYIAPVHNRSYLKALSNEVS